MVTRNNVTLVTGGTSGIGCELVKQFYTLENKIIGASSKQDRLAQLKSQFPKNYNSGL
jgi:short-subunit dehydrogenase involved in D-alanine esterification of teichoic acids